MIKNKIQIRRYHETDLPFLNQIFYSAIHISLAKDYTKAQLDAMAPATSLIDMSRKAKLQIIKPFVALIQGVIIGFAEFEPNGYIDRFYVHPDFQNHGVGTTLMKHIESEARNLQLSRIFADISITAKKFFQAKGFHLVSEQTVIRNSVHITNFAMQKILLP